MPKSVFGITESVQVRESSSPRGMPKFSGPFSRAEVENENGRVYSTALWQRILNEDYVKDALKNRIMLGRLGHPETSDEDIAHPSHIVTKLELRPDGVVWGEGEILPTPEGQVLKILFQAGVKVGVSSRGYIPDEDDLYHMNGKDYIPDSYTLETFDMVLQPSSTGACPTLNESTKKSLRKIITESKDKIDVRFVEKISRQFKLNEAAAPNEGKKQVSELFRGDKASSKSVKESVSMPTPKEGQGEMRTIRKAAAKVKKSNVSEAVLQEIINRYRITESALMDLFTERETRNAILRSLRQQRMVSEQALREMTDYVRVLESETVGLAKCKRNAKVALEELFKRYFESEDKLNEKSKRLLEARDGLVEAIYKGVQLKESLDRMASETAVKDEALEELRGRYLVAEQALKSLSSSYKVQEEALTKMSKKMQPINEDRQLSAKVVNELSVKYEISGQEIRNLFECLGNSKKALMFHLEERRKMAAGRYSEFPYMMDNRGVRRVTEQKEVHDYDYSETAQVPLENVVSRMWS